ncbi:hypothetical protein OC861_006394 [Tilletia horrida]|nr:hypothetical protein OC861_006394 [Tilletia horrida]
MGLALWFVPVASEATAIRAVQTRLRELHPSSPQFHPHVTLLAGFDPAVHGDAEAIWKKTTAKVAEWQHNRQSATASPSPLVATIQEVTTRNMYFQCILAALHKEESLLGLNSALREEFDLDSTQPPYYPHLSLAYGDLSPEQIQSTIEQLTQEKVFQRTSTGASIGVEPAAQLETLHLGTVELWDCEGPPEKWRQIKALTL